MFQHINTDLPSDAKIFFIYMRNLGFLCNRTYYSDSMFESHTIEKILARCETPFEVYEALRARGITHILYDIAYVFGPFSTFSEAGKTLFAEFQNRFLNHVKNENGRYYLYRVTY